jgi:predicted nicotinamide N-methyase
VTSGEDILASWKRNKFIVADDVVILTDIVFWSSNQNLIDKWCDEHDAKRTGMVISFGDPRRLTEFILTWSA